MHNVHAASMEARKGIGSLRAGVRDSCELPSNQGSLQVQPILLTTDPSL